MSLATQERTRIETNGPFRPSSYLQLWPDAPFSTTRELRIPCAPAAGDDYGIVRIPEGSLLWTNVGGDHHRAQAFRDEYLGEDRAKTTTLECVARLANMTLVVASMNNGASYMIEQIYEEEPALASGETTANVAHMALAAETAAPSMIRVPVMAQGELVYITQAA